MNKRWYIKYTEHFGEGVFNGDGDLDQRYKSLSNFGKFVLNGSTNIIANI